MESILRVFKKNSLVFFFTGLFAFVLPLSTKISNYLLLILLVTIGVNYGMNRKGSMSFKRVNWQYLFQTTLIIVCIAMIGLFYTSNIAEGLNLLKHDIYFLLVPLVFMWLDLSILTKIRKTSSIYFVLGSVLSALILLLNNFYRFSEYVYFNSFDLKVLFSYEFTYHEFAALLSFHPTVLGLYCTFAFVILNENKSYFKINVCIAFKVILLVCLLFLNSRTAFLFFCIYIVYYLINLYKLSSLNKKLFFRTVVIFSLVGILSIVLLKNTYIYKRLLEQVTWELTENKGTSYDGVYSNDSRMSRWKAIVDKSTEKPFLGFGTGMQGQEVLKAYEEHDLQYALKYKYDPHNFYLFILIEYGIVGLFLFVFLLLYQLIFYIKIDDVAFVFMLFIVIGCIFDSILYLTAIILLFAFFSNLYFFENKNKKN